jgi:hypothetical protein
MSNWLPYILAAVGALGAGIAFGQWYTARSKLALDLFDRRVAIYEDLRTALRSVVVHARVDEETILKWSEAQGRALFLFGRDVEGYLEGVRQSLIRMQMHATMKQARDQTAERRSQHIHHEMDHFQLAMGFYKEFPPLLARYARMDHKRPMWRLLALLKPRIMKTEPPKRA